MQSDELHVEALVHARPFARVSDRACLTGILFVLRSGIPWQMLPRELGCGSGMTCWRRVRDWQQAGVWDLMHFALLDWLARSAKLTGRGRSWTVVPFVRCTAVTRVGRGAHICLAQSVRRLRVRYDKRADIHEAVLSLGCALICRQSLRKTRRTA